MTDVLVPKRLRLTIDGTKFYTRAIIPAALSSIDDLPEFRGDDSPLSGMHGRQYLAKFRDNRVWHAVLYVLPTNSSGNITGSPAEQARANLDDLLQILGASGQRSVQRTMEDGSVRTCLAESHVDQVTDPTGEGSLARLIATFDMADPFWYGTDVVDSARSLASSPAMFSMSNPGNVRSNRMSFNLTGPNTGIRVTNDTTGTWWEYTAGVVASTKHLIVDTYAFTAANDGADVQGAIDQGTHVPFIEVDPDTNAFTVTATSPGGSLTSTLTPAYW